jgi:hypothetical protein
MVEDLLDAARSGNATRVRTMLREAVPFAGAVDSDEGAAGAWAPRSAREVGRHEHSV